MSKEYEQSNYLPAGTLLAGGRYRIVRHISSGGFGNTYEAVHVGLSVRYAVKEFFPKEFCEREEATHRMSIVSKSKVEQVERLSRKFLEEARGLATLRHPGIVRVHDVFEENGTAYFVMDFIEGRSLEAMLKLNGALKEENALYYIRQAAEALSYVHANNRLHLDLKPDNIMVDNQGNAILIDFGTSKFYDENTGQNNSTLLALTPGFAPPEQMSNDVRVFSPATDIYALGATFYRVLTGVNPPSSTSLASENEELKPLPAHISEGTRNAVMAAMQISSKKRPQSVADFLKLLEGAGVAASAGTMPIAPPVHATVDMPPIPPIASSSTTTSSSRKWLLPVIGGVAALAVILVLFLTCGGDKKAADLDEEEDIEYSEEGTEYTEEGENYDSYTSQAGSDSLTAADIPDIAAPMDCTAVYRYETSTKERYSIASQDYVESTDWNEPEIQQPEPPKEEVVLDNAIVEQQAQFPGGEPALLKFISDNIRYPAIAQENEVQGVVILRFKLSKDGSIGDVKIVRSLESSCDQEAMRVVKSLPRFTPARQQGIPVPVWFTLPIRFRIQ